MPRSDTAHEVETKWRARKVKRSAFHKFIWSAMDKVDHKSWAFLTTGGPDHYFTNSLGYVARHRDSADCKELTVKARVASDDIKVRVEHNVPLDLRKASPRVVHAFLKTLGFEKQVTVSKDCDIYFFKMKKPALHVSVVWYEVACKGHPNQAFVEVEVEGGTRKQKMRALHMWEAVVHAGLGLTKKDVSKDSLYEIYANQRYLIMADSNRPGRRSRK